MRRVITKIVVFILGISIGSYVPYIVYAGTYIDTAIKSSLCLEYKYGKDVLTDINIKIYRIADISKYGDYQISDKFDSYKNNINFSKLNSYNNWDNLANTLEAYVVADKIEPSMVGKTDSLGKLLFENIRKGIYLIDSEQKTITNNTYTFKPFFVSVPNLDINDSWEYNVVAKPKSEIKSKPDTDNILYKIKKHWLDYGKTNMRPNIITVDIYKNGSLNNTEVLSKDNNWMFVWKAKNDGSIWSAVERNVDKNYIVSIYKNDSEIVLTNTFKTPPIPPDKHKIIPKTGQLWWPTPLIAAVGIFLLTFGLIIYRRTHNE